MSLQRTNRLGTSGVDDDDNIPMSLVLASGPRKRLRGRRGSLKDLPSMPWDILYAVSSHATVQTDFVSTLNVFRFFQS